MKKNIVWLSALFLFLSGASFAQTQAPNPGFEDWPGIVTSSPKGWHSYDEAGGAFSGAASNKSGNPTALERVSGHRGKYACVIRCNKIMGVSANGALTTGRVYMGAMGAGSSKNYCFTDRANGYAYKFTGRPDSVYFWAKFKMQGDVYATAKAPLQLPRQFLRRCRPSAKRLRLRDVRRHQRRQGQEPVLQRLDRRIGNELRAACRDHHRIDHLRDLRMPCEPLRHRLDDCRFGQHPRLQRTDVIRPEDGVQLGSDEIGWTEFVCARSLARSVTEKWEAGKRYTYNILFKTSDDISVEVRCSNWDDINGETPEIIF